MKNIFLIIMIIAAIACKKDDETEKSAIDFSSVKVTEINEKDSVLYNIYYSGEIIQAIVKTSKINFNIPESYNIPRQDKIIDSTYFYYNSGLLDSAYRFLERYYPFTGLSGTPGFGRSSTMMKFIKNGSNLITKIENPINQKGVICIGPDFSYDPRGNILTVDYGFFSKYNIIYDKFNNVVQVCDTFDCYKYIDYDNSPNPYKAINDRLQYPYFDSFYCFSDNNASTYEDYSYLTGKENIKRTFQYDSQKRVIAINFRIKIKY